MSATLPAPPKHYDLRDQAETRRILEQEIARLRADLVDALRRITNLGG